MGSKKYSRREFLKATALGTAGIATAGSRLNLASVADAGSTRRPRLNLAATTITIIDPWSGGPDLNKAQIAQVKRFMDSQPNIKVERSDIVFVDFIQQLVHNAAAGDLPDIGLFDNPNFHGFTAQCFMSDLTV